MTTQPRPQAAVFDVIGTLFSLESQRPKLIACGLPGEALPAWFAASLRDMFALGVTGRTAPMIALLEDNLHQLLRAYRQPPDEARIAAVLAGMQQLDADPEAAAAIHTLRASGLLCAALSNGSRQATETLLERAGLRASFSMVLSIDEVGLPKPRPEVYHAMAARLELAPPALLMIASHPWDLHGARAAGLRTGYVSRGMPWPRSFEQPDQQATGLAELAGLA